MLLILYPEQSSATKRHFQQNTPSSTFQRDEIVSRVGQSEGEYKNTSGVITEDLGDGRFRAHFELPILGDRIWIVESQSREKLSVGDQVKVSKVYGQIVKVFKIEGE